MHVEWIYFAKTSVWLILINHNFGTLYGKQIKIDIISNCETQKRWAWNIENFHFSTLLKFNYISFPFFVRICWNMYFFFRFPPSNRSISVFYIIGTSSHKTNESSMPLYKNETLNIYLTLSDIFDNFYITRESLNYSTTPSSAIMQWVSKNVEVQSKGTYVRFEVN